MQAFLIQLSDIMNGCIVIGIFFCDGKENPNWRDTLIDLDKDDYEFEDGILRRIEK